MKRFAVPLVALAIAACSDLSTAPMAEEPQAVGGPSFIFASAEEVADFVFLLEDINDRTLPSLADASVAAELKGHIEALSAEMTARNTEAARAAYTDATKLLDGYSSKVGVNASDAADIESISLALAAADEMIGN